jgi:hypothetical protein
MLLAYVARSEMLGDTWKGFSADAFKYVLPTVKLATPSAVMVWYVPYPYVVTRHALCFSHPLCSVKNNGTRVQLGVLGV